LLTFLYFSSERFVYVGSHSGKFAAVDVEAGKEIWTVQLPDRIESTATIDRRKHLLFVGKK